MDVPRPSLIKFSKGMVWLFFIPALLGVTSCHKKSQNLNGTSTHGPILKKHKITMENVILRLENGSGRQSKLVEFDFNFYGTDLLPKVFEDQGKEIRNLILIHFANSNFENIPSSHMPIKDPKLSAYLNQFLNIGQIEESEYKLVRIY